jgi:hypothetical protein
MTDVERLRKAIESVEPGWGAAPAGEVCAAIVEGFGQPDEYGPDEAVMLKIAKAIYDVAEGKVGCA